MTQLKQGRTVNYSKKEMIHALCGMRTTEQMFSGFTEAEIEGIMMFGATRPQLERMFINNDLLSFL